jgi:hypothetical protein|tara:strand:+ start:137 stop:346 length:210 start_codon:yes stop_codon:yes gene_type:complete
MQTPSTGVSPIIKGRGKGMTIASENSTAGDSPGGISIGNANKLSVLKNRQRHTSMPRELSHPIINENKS